MSGRSLFRQEAIDFQRHHRQWGQVVLLQALPLRIMAWFIMAVVTTALVFLFVAQYARKETVAGYLTPGSGTARVFAPHPGTVGAIYVEQGQFVQEGQPLLSVTTSQIAADGEDVNATIVNSLTLQKASLNRQIAAEEHRAATERERLNEQMQALEMELRHMEAQIAIQRERIHVMERLVASANHLGTRGYISEVEQRRREEALLEQRQNLSALSQNLAARRSQHSEVRFNLQQLPNVTAERIQALRSELSAAEQRMAEANGRRAYIIRAPITGHISSLQASLGQSVDPQRLQLQILPSGSALQAELFIPARAIGFVEVGQDVRILYEAFPYQHFGSYRGRITRVSQTILTGTDVATPVPLKEPAYRASVAIQRQDVTAYGKQVPLQPDMLLKADIILERRSLMDWLLNPLRSARMQG